MDAAVASGIYGDASEVVQDALYLLQQQHRQDDATKLRRLRVEVQLGLDAMAVSDYDEVNIDEVGECREELSRPDGPRDEIMRRWQAGKGV